MFGAFDVPVLHNNYVEESNFPGACFLLPSCFAKFEASRFESMGLSASLVFCGFHPVTPSHVSEIKVTSGSDNSDHLSITLAQNIVIQLVWLNL